MEDPHLWSVEGGGGDPTSWGPKAIPPLALFTLHLATADTSFRKEPGGGGLVWAWGGYHDLSRHRCLLPCCCQGDIMNFDLKCSWLGATLVIQGRHFFSFLIFRVGGGEMRQYGCDPHNTQSALREHKHECAGKFFFSLFFHSYSVTFSVNYRTAEQDTVLLSYAIAFDW